MTDTDRNTERRYLVVTSVVAAHAGAKEVTVKAEGPKVGVLEYVADIGKAPRVGIRLHLTIEADR